MKYISEHFNISTELRKLKDTAEIVAIVSQNDHSSSRWKRLIVSAVSPSCIIVSS